MTVRLICILIIIALAIIIGCHKEHNIDWNNYKPEHPFGPSNTISYLVPESTRVILIVYNTNGKVIDTLINEINGPGRHDFHWIPDSTVADGIYFYKLSLGDSVFTKKMILMRQ